ncbi:MAG: gephyrin-like molybdotransferase Glp [Candidatus Eisenbacteria bacterium]
MASTGVPAEHLTLAEARARVLAAAVPLAAEEATLDEAFGRALGETVRAPHALPPFRNSSMDGFAVRAADAGRELPVGEVLAAGAHVARPLPPGQAARIMTGAMLPEGADAVVPFEEADETARDGAALVRARAAVSPGQNIRRAGEDIAQDEVALEAGRELSAHDLALLASLGITRVRVGRVPSAAIISTGDELLEPHQPLTPGRIRDSNRPMLGWLLEDCGARVVSSVHVGDDPAQVETAIRDALGGADIVLTIGGVSAGDFDPVKQSLANVGGVALWRVAMKPGRPQAFGMPQGRLFFGLPGNPASVACVFEVLVRPALRKLQGHAQLERPTLCVRSAETIASRVGRTDFVRTRLTWRHGEWWASPAGAQVSGHLTPQAWAHALLEVPEHAEAIERGEFAMARMLRWPDISGA